MTILVAGEIVKSVKCLPYRYEYLSLVSRNHEKKNKS